MHIPQTYSFEATWQNTKQKTASNRKYGTHKVKPQTNNKYTYKTCRKNERQEQKNKKSLWGN